MPAEHFTRRRVIYFDILRIVASFFVVFVHLAAQHWADVDVSSRAWFAFNLYCTTGKWSVPIFVMISGALFLGRDVSISAILKKNVARIATVFLFWSGCYALVYLVFRHAPLAVVLSQFITGHYHLWFLYMIVGLYLLIPLLRPIVQNETLTRYFLLLAFIFTFLLPQLALFLSFVSYQASAVLHTSSCTPTAFSRSASPLISSADTISAGGTLAAGKKSFSIASALPVFWYPCSPPSLFQGHRAHRAISSTPTIRSMFSAQAYRTSSLPSSI